MDLSKVSKFHLGALIAGGVSLLLSFFPSFVRVSAEASGLGINFSSGQNAWVSYATLGMLLVLLATAAVAVKAFAASSVPDNIPMNLIALAAGALGALLLILRAFTYSGGVPGVSVGPGWSGWLLFISSIALAVFAFLAFKDSGEKLPNVQGGDKPAA